MSPTNHVLTCVPQPPWLGCCCHRFGAVQVRFKIMRNIGLAFVRLGQYPDALQSFATVMDNVPDHQVCVCDQ